MTPSNHKRRGSVYVIVLGTVMIVTVMGLSALMVSRVERRSAEMTKDFGMARNYAHSAIEMGYYWISSDSTWRTSRPKLGMWITDQAIGTGSFSLEVTDPDDDDISAEPNNFVVLTGTGAQGDTRFTLQVTYAATKGGYEVSKGTWTRVVQ